ncbi:MAG: hypothetical protein CVU65_14690 [Deltaproteobacteria bacterium HGW-Deltaproteobacteria-22]|jgi:hypothetical protein|nr:MAG: hypothetical protein CVU65_14690 [Deltaproteobacteria bacterium HGW-Deltaproteobacteria-22]
MDNARVVTMKIGEILIHQNSITPEQLNLALWVQKHWGGLLGRILCSRGYLDEPDLTAALSSQIGIPATSLKDRSIPSGLCRLLPLDLCVSHLVMPFSQDPDSGVIQIAMTDPRDAVALAALRSSLKQPFRLFICGYFDLTEALYRTTYGQVATPVHASVGRATQEIIQADMLVEELPLPEPVLRTATPGRQHLSAGYEVLEEAEMLEAMSAQAAPKRLSAELDVVVDSGEFEIVSAEDSLAPSIEADQEPKTPTEGVPSPELTTEGSRQTDLVTLKQDAAAETSKATKDTLSDGKPKKPDEDAVTPGKADASVPVKTTSEDGPKSMPSPARRGLMAALAGHPRESESKPTAEKKPPPSPFDFRGKK